MAFVHVAGVTDAPELPSESGQRLAGNRYPPSADSRDAADRFRQANSVLRHELHDHVLGVGILDHSSSLAVTKLHVLVARQAAHQYRALRSPLTTRAAAAASRRCRQHRPAAGLPPQRRERPITSLPPLPNAPCSADSPRGGTKRILPSAISLQGPSLYCTRQPNASAKVPPGEPKKDSVNHAAVEGTLEVAPVAGRAPKYHWSSDLCVCRTARFRFRGAALAHRGQISIMSQWIR